MATGLRNIDIAFNFFTGSLPQEFATLQMLERFSAKDNVLTGPFFEPFGAAWRQLEYLNLDGTNFTGTIPATVLTKWADSMIDMNLGFTQFYGELPSEIGDLSQLTGLNINGPKLQGPIPELAKLSNLGTYSLAPHVFLSMNPLNLKHYLLDTSQRVPNPRGKSHHWNHSD
jgi:hypothetical protein